MKKGLLLLFCFPLFVMGQQTYVPDDNFEQEFINIGCDFVLDDSVLTASIDTITFLVISNLNIYSLEGIEALTSLKYFYCNDNQIDSLDISNNTSLIKLICPNNNLTALDVSANIALKELSCDNNPLTIITLNDTSLLQLGFSNTYLTTIDLSNNINLEVAFINNSNLSSINLNGATNLRLLSITDNQLTSLDISTNINLEILNAVNNDLSYLDLRNGNNINLFANVKQNPDLYCISVDDTALANINWTVNNSIDSQYYFSLDCNSTAINEAPQQKKQLLKIVNILSKESEPASNTPLFYIYSDGTVEKRIIIE